jgi:glycerol kinase
MERDTGMKLESLKVDGGASANDFLVQFQADISRLTAVRTASCEATARGAAALAGLALGFWQSREEIAALPTNTEYFEPKMEESKREELLRGWHRAVKAALYWADEK